MSIKKALNQVLLNEKRMLIVRYESRFSLSFFCHELMNSWKKWHFSEEKNNNGSLVIEIQLSE